MKTSGLASSETLRSYEPAIDNLDVKTAGLSGIKDLSGLSDPEVLEVAAREERVLDFTRQEHDAGPFRREAPVGD